MIGGEGMFGVHSAGKREFHMPLPQQKRGRRARRLEEYPLKIAPPFAGKEPETYKRRENEKYSAVLD